MATSVMTLREYADMLDEIAEDWDDEQPAVLIGDVTGSVDVSEQDGFSKYGSVGFAQECFDGNGVYELGQRTDLRFFGTMLIDPEDLAEEAQQELEESEWGGCLMFRAIVSADVLAEMLESVSVLVDECKIHLEEDGLEIRAVDPANVGMVDVSLDASAFESYDTDGGLLGVHLERLQEVVGFAESGQLVHLELDEETRKVEIEIAGLEYTLALIDPQSIRQEPDIPDLDLPATVVLEGSRLDRGVKAADLISDHIALEADEEEREFRFDAQGDTDDVTDTLDGDDLEDVDVDETVRSLFSLDYLRDLRKPIGGDAKVTMHLGSEMPVKFRYYGADGDLTVKNMLAPRIQDN